MTPGHQNEPMFFWHVPLLVDVQMKIKITRKLTGLLGRQLTKIITTTAQQNPKTAVAFGFKGFGGFLVAVAQMLLLHNTFEFGCNTNFYFLKMILKKSELSKVPNFNF